MTSKLHSLAYFNRLLMPVIVADVAKVKKKKKKTSNMKTVKVIKNAPSNSEF